MLEKTIQNNVMIIGAGQMGAGIAQLFAMNGFNVTLQDISDIALKNAVRTIKLSLEKLYEKHKISEKPENIIMRIQRTESLEHAAYSKIIIESAFEDFETKFNIISSVDKYVTESTYVATNTSSFSINDLSKAASYPANFIGFHFMNPVVLMDLIEIIAGINTSETTVQFFQNLSIELHKSPIVVKNSPGFVLNRILIPMINEAAWVLYEGISSAKEIDLAMTLGANHKLGPLALADLIGLDTVLAILRTLQEKIDKNKYMPCPLFSQYIAANRLGKKTSSGFYNY